MLSEMAVIPKLQGRGIGGWLHDVLLPRLLEPAAWLLIHPEAVRALCLYQNRGWQSAGTLTMPWSAEERLALVLERQRYNRQPA